jgi:hypothetical protein
MPQTPQFALSVRVFTQPEVQSVRPVSQRQLPVRQISPSAQVRPQTPQLSTSVCASTQVVPHAVRPSSQPQTLAAQV